MALRDLKTPPASVTEASAALDALDDALVGGFGRLSAANLEALHGLHRSFAATPLAGELAAAIAGISRSEFLDRHFLVLAAARSAVLGAMHDALLAQACAALGRPAPEIEAIAAGAGQAAPPQVEVWLESARHWLMELALAGFANLELEILLPFQATLDAMSSEPALVRQHALLGGFLEEMLAVFPRRGEIAAPRRRWADLWARALVLAAGAPEPLRSRPASGSLTIYGADLRQHDHLATLVVYGALAEEGAGTRLVRASVSASKVDVIQGAELGGLFAEVAPNLVAALASGQRLTLTKAPLLGCGDLIWEDSRTNLGAKAGALVEAAKLLAAAPALRPCLAPADRHPALIDELVFVPDSECAGGPPLPIERIPTTEDLLATDLAGNKGFVALLRFDGGAWGLQPLAIDKGKPLPRMVGAGLAAGAKGHKSSSLATLKERAGKLLRKKS